MRCSGLGIDGIGGGIDGIRMVFGGCPHLRHCKSGCCNGLVGFVIKAANKSGSAKVTNKSGFTNVHLTQSGHYEARMAFGGCPHYYGTYDIAKEAAAMVQELSLVQPEGRSEAYQKLSPKATTKSGSTNMRQTPSGRYEAKMVFGGCPHYCGTTNVHLATASKCAFV